MQIRNPLANPKYFAQDSLFVLSAYGVAYGLNMGPNKRRYYQYDVLLPIFSLLTPKLPETRLKISVSDESKLVNICQK